MSSTFPGRPVPSRSRARRQRRLRFRHRPVAVSVRPQQSGAGERDAAWLRPEAEQKRGHRRRWPVPLAVQGTYSIILSQKLTQGVLMAPLQ